VAVELGDDLATLEGKFHQAGYQYTAVDGEDRRTVLCQDPAGNRWELRGRRLADGTDGHRHSMLIRRGELRQSKRPRWPAVVRPLAARTCLDVGAPRFHGVTAPAASFGAEYLLRSAAPFGARSPWCLLRI
jgi:hypothetical protein